MIMRGKAKYKIGRMHAVKGKPHVNQIVISESRYHRLSVNRIPRKQLSDSRIGKNFSTANTSNAPNDSTSNLPTLISLSNLIRNIVTEKKIVTSAIKAALDVNSARRLRWKIIAHLYVDPSPKDIGVYAR
jgi:hypothetical protein